MKKVLIITYYWPPAGGPGVQRVLKFAKYLPQFGWEPIILTVDNGNYPALDESLLAEIPTGLKVVKTKSVEPFELYNKLRGKSKSDGLDTFVITKTDKSFKEKLGSSIRKYLFIPDARKGWKYTAVSKGVEIVNDEHIDAIFSSSPPHSLQLIASKIAKKTEKPWIADFRDPWANAFWLDNSQKKGVAYNINLKKESSVFERVDHFSTVSQGVRDNFLTKYPKHIATNTLIYNGYDSDDFKSVEKLDNKQFTIRYIGTLAESQNPIPFFEGISEIKNKSFKVEFWGKFDAAIQASVETYGLQDRVSFYPYVTHKEAVSLMVNSDMLLLVIPFENSKGILTGKLYEYIASANPILGLGPKDSEAGKVIEDNFVGQYFASKEGISAYIQNEINIWSNGDSYDSRTKNISKFSRKFATEQLSRILDQLVE